MDKISQILDSIKERLSSPLLFSFAISWLFINWKITVALLWYDPPASSAGHLSLIDYISVNTNNWTSIALPGIFAVAYTLLSPFIKSLISLYQTVNINWGEKWNLKISKGSKVPIEKYLTLRSSYAERTAALEKIIETESATITKLQDANTALLQARDTQNKLGNDLADSRAIIDNYSNVSFLLGKWIKKIKNDNIESQENIEIHGNIVSVYKGATSDQRFMVNNFAFDRRSRRLQFTLFHYSSQGTAGRYPFFAFSDLNYQHEQLVGYEYQNEKVVEVTYTRS